MAKTGYNCIGIFFPAGAPHPAPNDSPVRRAISQGFLVESFHDKE